MRNSCLFTISQRNLELLYKVILKEYTEYFKLLLTFFVSPFSLLPGCLWNNGWKLWIQRKWSILSRISESSFCAEMSSISSNQNERYTRVALHGRSSQRCYWGNIPLNSYPINSFTDLLSEITDCSIDIWCVFTHPYAFPSITIYHPCY